MSFSAPTHAATVSASRSSRRRPRESVSVVQLADEHGQRVRLRLYQVLVHDRLELGLGAVLGGVDVRAREQPVPDRVVAVLRHSPAERRPELAREISQRDDLHGFQA